MDIALRFELGGRTDVPSAQISEVCPTRHHIRHSTGWMSVARDTVKEGNARRAGRTLPFRYRSPRAAIMQMRSAVRMAILVMVSDGFTPPVVGKIEPCEFVM